MKKDEMGESTFKWKSNKLPQNIHVFRWMRINSANVRAMYCELRENKKKKKNNSNNNEDSEYSEFILTVNRKKSVYFKQYFLLCVCVCTREVRPIVSGVYCAYFARFILLSIKIWTKAIRLYSSNGSQHWRNMYVCMRKKNERIW